MEPYNGTYEQVELNTIIVDHRYQRDLKPALVAAIAADPRWELFGVPVLFKRENTGMFYCADGQQRITGMKETKEPPKTIPAVWFPVEGLATEAAVFVHINEFRKGLTAIEKHKGKIVAKDPSTLAIERAVETAGLTVSAGKSTQDARNVSAVSALYAIYNTLGEEGVLQTLVVSRDAFTDDSGAFSAPILKGVAEIIAEQDGDYERQKLTRALQRTTVPQILRKTEELRFDLGGSRQRNVRRAIKTLARI